MFGSSKAQQQIAVRDVLIAHLTKELRFIRHWLDFSSGGYYRA